MNVLNDAELLGFMGKQEAQSICPSTDYIDDAFDYIAEGDQITGDRMPWEKTHTKVRFREGEVTLWAGTNGNGKSLVLGQVALWLMPTTTVLQASLEMPPKKTVARMLKQGSGGPNPGSAFKERFKTHSDNFWIYDQTDSIQADRMLAVCAYAAEKLGIKHIMIDSLMKCVAGDDDYNGQKQFVDALCWIARKYNIHIHLVHHTRKSASETDIPDKHSVKGAGAIVDLVDNLVIVHRNTLKEKWLRENDQRYEEEAPDCYLRVAKQRHGDWDGIFYFWFHPESQQWIPKHEAGPLPWPSYRELYQ